MGIAATVNGDTLMIKMDEKFDYSKVQEFSSAYEDVPASVSKVVIDLAVTEYMDSSALGMLLNMQKKLGADKYSYAIVNCGPRVERILKISRFDKKFSIN